MDNQEEVKNSKDFELTICKCGALHLTFRGQITHAADQGKDLLLICGKCGAGKRLGATKIDNAYHLYKIDEDTKKTLIYDENAFSMKTPDKKPIYRIYYEDGYRVPMNSGMYATDYAYGKFSDRWYPDFYEISGRDLSAKEIQKFIADYHRNRTTVDMTRFIRETPSWVLDILSNYLIEGFDWKGTEYDKTLPF